MTLEQQLKQNIINTYKKIGDEKALLLRCTGCKNVYTGNEIAEEIEKETEFGIKMVNSLINLSIDLVKRDKRNIEIK